MLFLAPLALLATILPLTLSAPLPAKIWHIPDECYDDAAHFYGYCSPLEVGRGEPKGFGFRTDCGCYSPCQVCKGCHCQHSRWASEAKRPWPQKVGGTGMGGAPGFESEDEYESEEEDKEKEKVRIGGEKAPGGFRMQEEPAGIAGDKKTWQSQGLQGFQRGTKAPPPMTGYLGEHTWSQPKVRDNRDD